MPDRREPEESPYTADQQFAGAYEGETVTRRRFMTGSAHALGGIATAAFALPALGFAVGPMFERHRAQWKDVGPIADFPAASYVPRVITVAPGIGEAGKTTAYIRKHNAKIDGPMKDSFDQYIAMSTRCAHLGCPVRFIEASQRFVCPCHGGVYDFQGKVSGGPPVRPLDRFYTRVRAGRLELGPRYSVNSELKRFSPRDPAQDLDGFGQYLFPSRFSTPNPSK